MLLLSCVSPNFWDPVILRLKEALILHCSDVSNETSWVFSYQITFLLEFQSNTIDR
jgi:hypothetical protein